MNSSHPEELNTKAESDQVNGDQEKGDQAQSKSGQPRRSHLILRLAKAAAFLATIGTLGGLLADQYWILDILAQFKVQYVFLAMPAFVYYLCRKRWVMATVLCAVLVFHLSALVPYFIAQSPSTATKESTHRLLSFNLLRTNTNFQETIESIVEQDADFMFLMEVHHEWLPYFEKVKAKYPYQKIVPSHGYTGVAFLSKTKWLEIQVFKSGHIPNPSIDVLFGVEDDQLRIIGTHPVPPFGTELTESREQQLTEIASGLDKETANLVVGDFNVTPWAPSFPRILAAGNLEDASKGFGITPTLAPLPTWFGGLKVDHILKSERIKTVAYEVVPNPNSDHHMLVFEFEQDSEN